ncbi:ankyrin repeat domain-containing protein [Pseudovibrio sp. Ad26]|uniref:ankyrin repeat domain-containing protein n=1 Tax=Pseudovibrio sp. Ad26 TaxID=989410 RepID=UPI0007B1D689|nr:ankyrin repeat domain-containing protein [Pseudovibrio sp. Ad26]KZL16380.1 Ankyrin repeats (3 copies) [Pseudovibrio sp. Ad26]
MNIKLLAAASIVVAGMSVSAFAGDIDVVADQVWSGDIAAVKTAIEADRTLVTAHNSGNSFTLLHLSAMNGNLKIATYLLENGAEVNAVDADNLTALHRASANKNQKIVDLLKKHGATQ